MTDNTNKTHYRSVFNSPYLSSADITEPTILTIARVVVEKDKTNRTSEQFNTAYFVEKEIREGEELKPLILNAINSRTMAGLCKSKYINDWQNVAVTVFVDANVRFGRDTVEGLRIAQDHPRIQKRELTPDNEKSWLRAVEVYKQNGSLEVVKAKMTVSVANEKKIIAEAA